LHVCINNASSCDEATSGRAGKKVGDSKGQTAFTVVHQSTGEIFKQDISFNLVQVFFFVSNAATGMVTNGGQSPMVAKNQNGLNGQ
jgi:hypothetical protein